MKRVLLLGATGTAGIAVAERLLSDTDCHVTLFARHAGDRFSDGPVRRSWTATPGTSRI